MEERQGRHRRARGRPGARKHHRQGQDGERQQTEEAIPPRHPLGPPAARRETVPNPRYPRGNNTQRPLAARGSSQRVERSQRPGRPGDSARPHVPFSPLLGSVPQATEPGDTVSALRGAEGPEALRGQPPATGPPGRRAHNMRTLEGQLIIK